MIRGNLKFKVSAITVYLAGKPEIKDSAVLMNLAGKP